MLIRNQDTAKYSFSVQTQGGLIRIDKTSEFVTHLTAFVWNSSLVRVFAYSSRGDIWHTFQLFLCHTFYWNLVPCTWSLNKSVGYIYVSHIVPRLSLKIGMVIGTNNSVSSVWSHNCSAVVFASRHTPLVCFCVGHSNWCFLDQLIDKVVSLAYSGARDQPFVIWI